MSTESSVSTKPFVSTEFSVSAVHSESTVLSVFRSFFSMLCMDASRR